MHNFHRRGGLKKEINGVMTDGVLMRDEFYEDEVVGEDDTHTRSGHRNWIRWETYLTSSAANTLPDNKGKSFPSTVKVVAKLPEGAIMHRDPLPNGKWRTDDRASWEWSYDPDTHTATYEGPLKDGGAARLNLSFSGAKYKDDTGEFVKYPITMTITENP